MKIVLSIPNGLIETSDRLRKDLKMSRSRLYATAIEEFVAMHSASNITERLNAVYGQNHSGLDGVIQRLQARSIHRQKW